MGASGPDGSQRKARSSLDTTIGDLANLNSSILKDRLTKQNSEAFH